MNNNLSDEDEDILMTKMFAEEKTADKKEFAEFAAPFSEIEKEENLLEIPEAEVVAPPVSESSLAKNAVSQASAKHCPCKAESRSASEGVAR